MARYSYNIMVEVEAADPSEADDLAQMLYHGAVEELGPGMSLKLVHNSGTVYQAVADKLNQTKLYLNGVEY